MKETQTSWDCENAEMIYVVRKAHLSNVINDNECDDCKKDRKIVTIRTRFGFWYKEEVDSSVKLEAELGLEPEDQVVVVASGG